MRTALVAVVVLVIAIAASRAVPPAITGDRELAALQGAVVVADDGQVLGKVTNSVDTKSIISPYGAYGSAGNPASLSNKLGRYGSFWSMYSPYCMVASRPPRLVRNGRFLAYLTTNVLKGPRVDPTALLEWLKASSPGS